MLKPKKKKPLRENGINSFLHHYNDKFSLELLSYNRSSLSIFKLLISQMKDGTCGWIYENIIKYQENK